MNTITVNELYQKVNDGEIISDIELQRAIVYNNDKQALVIDSLYKGIPLPAIYLWHNDEGKFEVLDGKQRIESIRKFMQNDLQYNGKLWREWGRDDSDFQQRIKNVVLTVIECSGTDEQKRTIFNRINRLGVALSPYEVLNGLFHGLYLQELTDYYNQDSVFRKVLKVETLDRGANKYIMLKYIYEVRFKAKPSHEKLEEYLKTVYQMSAADDVAKIHKRFKFICDIFDSATKLSRDILLKLANENLTQSALWKQNKSEINKALRQYISNSKQYHYPVTYDDVVSVIKAQLGGITLDPRRYFSDDQKQQLIDQRTPDDSGRYRCELCPNTFFPHELEVDHVKPWSLGGPTELSNAQLLCKPCNSAKGNH